MGADYTQHSDCQMIQSSIDLLHPEIRARAHALLETGRRRGLRLKILETLRDPARIAELYPDDPNRFSLHLCGLALDVGPDLKCESAEWPGLFNSWPFWEDLQRNIAPEAGFDHPQPWQLDRDRDHVQCCERIGLSEGVLRSIWISGGYKIEPVMQCIDCHIK